jgi:hypothetical protein
MGEHPLCVSAENISTPVRHVALHCPEHCADGQMQQPKEHSNVWTSCTKYSSSQSVTNSLGTYTLISSSSDCSSSFYSSCEVTAQVRKANLTVLSGDGNLQIARSGCIISWWRHTFNCHTFD